ncbi:MAG TPA: O-antigen ligase family protein [Patescibacteria group bacterium]|nr:O-antigen ligase family protein [Patescibacteria group bacterium]
MKNKVQMGINLLIIIFMPFMMYINLSDTKVNFAVADMLLALAGVMFIINIKEFFVQKRLLYLLYFIGLLLSLFLSQYISQFNGDFLHVGYNVMIMEMEKTIVVAMYFFTAFIFVRNERDFKVTLAAISLSSIPVMIVGVISYTYFLLGKDFFIEIYEIETLRFLGSFADPNLCAFYFILIFFVSILNFRVMENKALRLLILGISVLSLAAIFLTMSRGGWLAFAGAVAAFILLNIKNLKKESIIVVISIIIIAFTSIGVDYYFQQGKITINMVSRIQDSLIKDVEDIDRIQLIKAAFYMGNDNFLFGVGKGSFPLNSYKYLSKDNIQYKRQFIPHNTFLGFYSQQGIVGVLIFFTLPGYILYSMIKSRRKQNLYFIPLIVGLFIHSMTINVENVRFLWYILGLMLVAEKLDICLDFEPTVQMNKRTFNTVLTILLLLALFSFIDLSRKLTANIYTYKGDLYERKVFLGNPGNYELTFDIRTDNHLHSVEIYDDTKLLRKMSFRSAFGTVHIPVYLENECRVIFKSNEEGWMKVKNAHIIGNNIKAPLYDYILLPRVLEDWANNREYLAYADEPSFKKQFDVGDDKLNAFEILNGRVIRYSNLSHMYQFNMKSKRMVDTNYQLDLLSDYSSISELMPDEVQKNLLTHRFTISPLTINWKEGHIYSVKSRRLFSSDDFDLYGRYYDYVNKKYIQKSYFPIQYELVKENQEIIELGESRWINICYNRDKENIIHMTKNAWVESGRMDLEPGDYEITFISKGTFLEEYPKLRLRDSSLNEIAEITLDDTMKEYTVKYHVDEPKEGISFILELINYKSEKDVGNRKVLLKDWLKVSKVN